jgi:hypothetical protein
MAKRRLKRERRAILDERERLIRLRNLGVVGLRRYVEDSIAESSSSKARMLEDLACLFEMLTIDLHHNKTALDEVETELETPAYETRMREVFEQCREGEAW